MDTGFLDFRTPAAYPLAECNFCTCTLGKEIKGIWEHKAQQQQQSRAAVLFQSAGIPPKYQSLLLGGRRLEMSIATLQTLSDHDPMKQPAIKVAQQFMQQGCFHSAGRCFHSLKMDGPYGTGKTGLATLILKSFAERGASCLWLDYHHLLATIQAGYRDGQAAERLELAEKVDCLLIDDFGKAAFGAESGDKVRLLEMIINSRLIWQRSTIITTNLDDNALIERFGPTLYERFKEDYVSIFMGGCNLREVIV